MVAASMTTTSEPLRILAIDDNQSVLEDIRSIFSSQSPQDDSELDEMLARLLGQNVQKKDHNNPEIAWSLDTADQGEAGLVQVRHQLAQGLPYDVILVDMRMPPGWDGAETIARIAAEDPNVRFALVTAYNDHSWQSVISQVGCPDRLLLLRKPFESDELLQLALVLGHHARAARIAAHNLEKLQQTTEEQRQKLRDSANEIGIVTEQLDVLRLANDRLLNACSHRLRTPLTTIIGLSDILTPQDIPPAYQDALQHLTSSTKDLSQLIDDLTLLTHLSQAEGQPGRETTDLGGVLVQLFGEPRAKRSMPPHVRSDASRLHQVLHHWQSFISEQQPVQWTWRANHGSIRLLFYSDCALQTSPLNVIGSQQSPVQVLLFARLTDLLQIQWSYTGNVHGMHEWELQLKAG
jgi:CheY-like chemotaxis protein